MKKITFIFALLCASVMGMRAEAVYTGVPFSGAFGDYDYNIAYTITYDDNHNLTFAAEFTGSFQNTTGFVFEVWSSDLSNGDHLSFTHGEGNSWSVKDSKNYESMEGQALANLRLRIASAAGGTDQLYISDYTVGKSGVQVPTYPVAAPANPTYPQSAVTSIYSNTYSSTGYSFGEWSGGTVQSFIYPGGNQCAKFVNSASGYFGMQFVSQDVSNKHFLHLDVWSAESITFGVVPISQSHNSLNCRRMITTEAATWTAIDIPLDEFKDGDNVLTLTDVFQIKFDNCSNTTFFLDNIYFYNAIEFDTNWAAGDVYGTTATCSTVSTANPGNTEEKALVESGMWESVWDQDPQWWMVDLKQLRVINTVAVNWATRYGSNYDIEISRDGSNFTTIATETGATGNAEKATKFSTVLARYIRLNLKSRGAGYGYEIKQVKALFVDESVLTSLSISPAFPFCPVSGSVALNIVAKDQYNFEMDPGTISYTISPADAGSISDNVYTPAKKGLATITAHVGDVYAADFTIFGYTGSNLAFEKEATAGQNAADAYKANNSDRGDRWGSGNLGTKPNDDWWYVNLGGVYDIDAVFIKWETARPKYYVIEVSEDPSASWNAIGSYDELPYNDGRYQSYTGLTAIPGQYLRVRATDRTGGYDNLNWGISMFDIQVFGSENVSAAKSVSAIPNDANMGFAQVQVGGVDVTSVDNGTEVTFTATPAEGYEFVNWTQGGVVIPGAGASYTTTITANTALVANFEATRTAYCSTSITDDNFHSTLYVSITNPSGNTYKILVEGTASNRIESAYNNFSFGLTHINGETGTTYLPASSWTTDNTGYGSAYVTFTADNFRDITFVQRYIVLNKQGGGLLEFRAFPDANLIQWSATCIDSDAPVLEAPIATPIGATSVRLDVTATDLVAGLLTYHVNYKPTGDTGAGENINFQGASGETTSKTITGLSNGVEYTFSVTVTDGTNESDAQVCTATPAMTPAPVPTTNAKYVLSVYSDAYESALAHDFSKNTWTGIPYTELDINGDHALAYTNPNSPAQMPDVAWGVNNNGDEAIIALDEFNDGTNKGLDVRGMTYIHFDIWSSTATTYPELRLNDTEAGHFSLDGNGWQSIELPLAGISAETLRNIRWMKFIALRDPAPDQIVIDNVYFYAVPEDVEFVDNGSNADLIETKHKHFVNATINRSFAANGEWFTLCLPFDMDAALINDVFGASTIAEMVSAEDRGSLIHLNFDYINEIKAGKAYLFKPGNDFTAGTTINGVQIKNVDPHALRSVNDYMEFEGTFSNKLLENDNQRFVGPENYLYSPAANGTNMKAFRCFFTIPEGPQQNNVMGKRARIVFGPQETTDIDQINDQEPNTTGKLIINGQLYIIRDGKTYNAQGMLVK